MAFRDHTKTLLIISSALAIALVVVIAINAQSSMQQMSRNNAELYNAYRISEIMKAFRSNFNVLENKRKGYLITGDPKFLEVYREHETKLKTQLRSLEAFFESSEEEPLFEQLKELSYHHFAQGKSLASSTNLSGFRTDGQLETDESSTGGEIRLVLDAITEKLDSRTKILIENSLAYVTETRNWNIAEISLALVLILTAIIIVVTDINTRNRLEKELRDAKRKSDENAQIKEQFMANMSHEIRTPLNAIIGFSHLLEKSTLSSEQREHLQAITGSSQNLLNIVNDILDFSKLEAGQLNIEKVSFQLKPLFEHIHTMFLAKAAENNIVLTVHCEKNVPTHLFGDPVRLQQILINLVNNAIKFTEKGSVNLRCELTSLQNDVAQLTFRIQDTGIGIDEDKLESIFERFKQASSDTTRKYGGTGLGLSIVRDLVDRQNGTIHVKSKPGLGTEFVVQLSYPLSFEIAPSSSSTAIDHTSLSTGNYAVLLVEDNVLNQKLTSTYLKQVAIEVDIAGDGKQALAALAAKQFDLILLDIQMPVMDGYETAQAIRTSLNLNVPIIAMTANTLEGEKEKCLRHGMNDYLSKPFKESELLNILRHWLPEKKQSVDLSQFYSLTMGNKQFMREMIDLYLNNNPKEIEQLSLAADKPDFKTAAQIAHKLKTSVGFMGLSNVLPMLDKIEALGTQQSDKESLKSLVALVSAHCKASHKIFQKELQQLESA